MAKTHSINSLEITSYNKKGRGIGLHVLNEKQAIKVEVPGAVIGDLLSVSTYCRRNEAHQADILKILTPGQDRVTPRCRHVPYCGGCSWQQISYQAQLQEKNNRLRALFQTLNAQEYLLPIIPCDPEWNYRNKMDFTFSQDKTGNRYLGLIEVNSRGRAINLQECHLTNPWMVELLAEVRKWWKNEDGLNAFQPNTEKGALRNLILREGMHTGDRLVNLVVSGNPQEALFKPQINRFIQMVRETAQPQGGELVIFMTIHQAIKGQKTQFYEMHLSGPEYMREILKVHDGKNEKQWSFNISPTAFFQPNSRQAEKLYSNALQMANLDGARVFDLYCGTGTLGLVASTRAQSVVGIELSKQAILDAKENAKHNGVTNASFYDGDVAHVLPRLDGKADVAIIDPPRSGLEDAAILHLQKLAAKEIIYISCNPHSQVEDLKKLLGAGYRIVQIQPVDQFPHTVHIETIVKLVALN